MGRVPASRPGHGLAVGLDEPNAHLLAAGPEVPPPFVPWRDLLVALRPRYLRLVVDWAKLQPSAGSPPALDLRQDGCLRGVPPCGAYAGLRAQLQAIASQQRAVGGFSVVLVIAGTPAWAARPAGGCERPGISPSSRALRPSALSAYRALIRSILALGRELGVALPWWSPWNEPNHPLFISPQRDFCRGSAPARSPAVYVQLARAMAAQLRAEGGGHRLLLGELAGFVAPEVHAVSVREFVDALPPEVLCLGSTWSVHAYAHRGAGPEGPVGQLEAALDRAGGCARAGHVWVTEIGAGAAARAGALRPPGGADARAGCRSLAVQLARWSADPRVEAVFQYTFREDPLFPVGLADAGLTRLYPAYWLWRAWGGGRAPAAPAPALPSACA